MTAHGTCGSPSSLSPIPIPSLFRSTPSRQYLSQLTKTRGLCSRRYRYYCLSILDKHHHRDIDFEQGLKILRMCTDELKRRMPIDFKGMLVKVITEEGIREIDYEDDKPVKAA